MTLDPAQLHIKEWQGENFRPVNQFYKQQKHKGSASGEERVFVIEHHGAIIAAVRLVPYEAYFWLRSLYVAQAVRGQGLGGELLNYAHTRINQPIYCFPYIHLDHFYQNAGYSLINTTQMPQAIEQLFTRYNRKGQSILAMAKLT